MARIRPRRRPAPVPTLQDLTGRLRDAAIAIEQSHGAPEDIDRIYLVLEACDDHPPATSGDWPAWIAALEEAVRIVRGMDWKVRQVVRNWENTAACQEVAELLDNLNDDVQAARASRLEALRDEYTVISHDTGAGPEEIARAIWLFLIRAIEQKREEMSEEDAALVRMLNLWPEEPDAQQKLFAAALTRFRELHNPADLAERTILARAETLATALA